jgi:hypothetical protein
MQTVLSLALGVGSVHGWIAGAIAFVSGWIYCTATYGFLLGFGLGWLASGILAVIVFLAFSLLWLPFDILVVTAIIYILEHGVK